MVEDGSEKHLRVAEHYFQAAIRVDETNPTNHLKYGSTYKNEVAKAGYYSTDIDKYNVKGEFTASKRVGVSKLSFPKGQANILLNLGLGLTTLPEHISFVESRSEQIV